MTRKHFNKENCKKGRGGRSGEKGGKKERKRERKKEREKSFGYKQTDPRRKI